MLTEIRLGGVVVILQLYFTFNMKIEQTRYGLNFICIGKMKKESQIRQYQQFAILYYSFFKKSSNFLIVSILLFSDKCV